jgi:sulfur relay (sulfurtransferase) complex TusBCD TusD component (DsrE family)
MRLRHDHDTLFVGNFKEERRNMKIGIVIASNDAETCWNALRYGNFAIGQGDEVKVFFMGKGVEYQNISNDKFNTIEQAEKFAQSGGKIYACGSCIKLRNQGGTEMCPINTMKDMYDIVKESDKVVTF